MAYNKIERNKVGRLVKEGIKLEDGITPDPFSFTSSYIELIYGSEILGIATGFIWELNDTFYLVTNWHVFSGIDPNTDQPIDKKGGSVPDSLSVYLHTAVQLGKWEKLNIQLYDPQGRPRWKEHNEFRSKVDVAIIQIEEHEQFQIFPINKQRFEDFKSEISNDVFIIGYPKGVSGGGLFPIWKRGSIASEPDLDIDGVPKIMIDSATRDGMSGSPVIAKSFSPYMEINESGISTGKVFPGRKLIGIYSGRNIGDDELEAQLGIIWKASVIDEIINFGVRPD